MEDFAAKGQSMTVHSMTATVLDTSMVLSSGLLTCGRPGSDALFCHSKVIAPPVKKIV